MDSEIVSLSTTVTQLKIFILEDDPDRIRLFCKWFGPGLGMNDPIRWDCIHSCERDYDFVPPYDVMFLDHDLGGRKFTDAEDDGTLFVSTIRHAIPTDTPIIVHSHNIVAAERMVNMLRGVTAEVAAITFGSPAFLENIREIQRLVNLEVNA